MDTTEKYIKMCEKAGEIQKQRPNIFEDIKSYWHPAIPNVWLPRQDQLQEMVADRLLGLQTVCAEMYEFAISAGETSGITIDGTMEQLWLAYVMHEKYQKVWDEEEEEWVN